MSKVKKPGLNLAAKLIGFGGVILCILIAAAYLLLFYPNLPFEVPKFIPLMEGYSPIHLYIIGGVAGFCIILAIIFGVASRRGKSRNEENEFVPAAPADVPAPVADEAVSVAEDVAETAPASEAAEEPKESAPEATDVQAPAEAKKNVFVRAKDNVCGFVGEKVERLVPEKSRKAIGKTAEIAKKNVKFVCGFAVAVITMIAIGNAKAEKERQKQRNKILELLK